MSSKEKGETNQHLPTWSYGDEKGIDEKEREGKGRERARGKRSGKRGRIVNDEIVSGSETVFIVWGRWAELRGYAGR